MNRLISPLQCAEILKIAYRYEELEPWPMGFNPSERECRETDTQFLWEYLPDKRLIYVGFPGTSSLRDVITDAMFCTKILPYGNSKSKIKVHGGFLNAYKSIRGYIHDYISRYKPRHIIVFGHSLGSALATLCAVDIQFNTGLEPIVYTTGAPKIGNKAFRESYNNRILQHYRFENEYDFVTWIPPFGAYSVGNLEKLVSRNHDIRKYIQGLKIWEEQNVQ